MKAELNLLPGVSEDYVRMRLSAAGGKEIETGKFSSPESSAALAVNGFAWFHERPNSIPILPGTDYAGWPAISVEVESCCRFPWSGGKHPWLDAAIETRTHLLGVESKRHEPFRDAKKAVLSKAYDRPKWGTSMGPFERMRDLLRSKSLQFKHLDAAQLVKHAFGLVTEGKRRGKKPVLFYLHAEPSVRRKEDINRHREEVADFGQAVKGAEVTFASATWREWLDSWEVKNPPDLKLHQELLIKRFEL